MKRFSGKPRHAFTLIELIAVIVVLAILAGVALPKFLDAGDDARQSAADGSIAALQTALHQRYVDNRATDAPQANWIRSINQIASTLEFNELPDGLTIENDTIIDQTGTAWTFTAETLDESARLSNNAQNNNGNNGGNNGSLGNGQGNGSFAN